MFLEYWVVDTIERNPWEYISGKDFGFGEVLLTAEIFSLVLKWWMLQCSSVCQSIILPIIKKWVLWGWKYFQIFNNIAVLLWKEAVEKKKLKIKLKIVKVVEEAMDLFNKPNFQLTNMLFYVINFLIFFPVWANQEKILSMFFF